MCNLVNGETIAVKDVDHGTRALWVDCQSDVSIGGSGEEVHEENGFDDLITAIFLLQCLGPA
jgi:hypothetical protein